LSKEEYILPGEVAALFSAICYALSYILLRKGQAETKADELDNGLFPILFISSSVLLLCLILKAVLLSPTPLISGSDWKISVGFCVLSGLVGTLLGRLALYAAISRIGATRGVIINAMSPIVTLSIAITVLGEKLNLSDSYGMFFLISGMLLLSVERVWFPSRFIGRLFQQGVVIAILASLLQGVGHTFRKIGVDTSISAPLAATLDTVSALVVYTVLLCGLGRLKSVVSPFVKNPNPYIITAGLLSAAAVLLFFGASDSIPVSQVSMITSIQPVIVALLSAVFMRNLERLTWITLISSILVTLGVVLMSV
jgi:drug/metabolite transporter (DMT)-like permease